MPEAEVHGGCGHGGSKIFLLKFAADQIHSAQPKILHRAHPKMFLATPSQGRRGNAKGSTDFLDVNCSIAVGIKPVAEAPHDLLVAKPSGRPTAFYSVRKTRDHRSRQGLFQRPYDFRVLERFFTRRYQPTQFVPQPSKPREVFYRRLPPKGAGRIPYI